jgi:hypothetical protein
MHILEGIAACYEHNFAIKTNGTVVGWGQDAYAVVSTMPDLQDIVEISGKSARVIVVVSDRIGLQQKRLG